MTQTLFEKESEYFFPTYKRLTLDIVRGEGCYLYDRSGKRYLDFFGGLAVNALGYGHPRVNAAIMEQVKQYIHLSNFYVQEPQVTFAEKLIRASGMKKLFLSNSGTEAIEGALKLARKWGRKYGKTQMFGLSNSFHGRTMGALSLTERAKYRDGYEPFLPNVGHIKFNDVEDLRKSVNEQTLGLVLEFIQGEGGVNVASQEFVSEMNELRSRYGFLIIADEIQSGIGRTGKFFGFEHFGIRPDIVVVAKAIGGGLPLGAFLGTEKVADALTPGVHGTTFGGNPVACAAGIVALEEIVEKGLMKRAGDIGDYLKRSLSRIRNDFPALVKEIRGFGCMIGVDLAADGQPIANELQNRGILVNCTNTTVLRLLPPYIISEEQCDQLTEEIRSVFRTIKD